MKRKSKKGYSLMETTAGILLIAMAAIIIIIGTKAGLLGYTEGRKIHTINEKLMSSVEKGIVTDGKIEKNEKEATITSAEATYEFKGIFKTYTYKEDNKTTTYTVFE